MDRSSRGELLSDHISRQPASLTAQEEKRPKSVDNVSGHLRDERWRRRCHGRATKPASIPNAVLSGAFAES